jgi:hypothetical protein
MMSIMRGLFDMCIQRTSSSLGGTSFSTNKYASCPFSSKYTPPFCKAQQHGSRGAHIHCMESLVCMDPAGFTNIAAWSTAQILLLVGCQVQCDVVLSVSGKDD